jgi:type II secretory pathway component PulJ
MTERKTESMSSEPEWKVPVPSSEDTLSGEDGYTVLESTIAAALLSTVLVLVIGMLVVFTSHHAQRDRIAGLAVAQHALETSIDREHYEPASWSTQDGRWALERTAHEEEGTVTVTVRVWRTRSANPEATRRSRPALLQLSTARFLPTDA